MEILLVRSIEGTVVESEMYDTALEQANVILRYRLGTRIFSSSFCRRWAYGQSYCDQLARGSAFCAYSWI